MIKGVDVQGRRRIRRGQFESKGKKGEKVILKK